MMICGEKCETNGNSDKYQHNNQRRRKRNASKMKKNLIFTRFFFYFRFVLVRRSCWCLCGCFFFSPETNARRIYVSRIFCTSHTHELQRQARKTNHASQQDKTHTSTVCRTHKVFQHHRNTKEKCCRIFKCNKSSKTY